MIPTLNRLVSHYATSTPTRPALVCEERCWTYTELATASDSLAMRMVEAGLSHERVALMLPNGPETVI